METIEDTKLDNTLPTHEEFSSKYYFELNRLVLAEIKKYSPKDIDLIKVDQHILMSSTLYRSIKICSDDLKAIKLMHLIQHANKDLSVLIASHRYIKANYKNPSGLLEQDMIDAIVMIRSSIMMTYEDRCTNFLYKIKAILDMLIHIVPENIKGGTSYAIWTFIKNTRDNKCSEQWSQHYRYLLFVEYAANYLKHEHTRLNTGFNDWNHSTPSLIFSAKRIGGEKDKKYPLFLDLINENKDLNSKQIYGHLSIEMLIEGTNSFIDHFTNVITQKIEKNIKL